METCCVAGYIGLISESRKRRMQNALPDPLIFEDVGDEILPKPSAAETDNANPWGVLAKTWSHFDRVRQPRPPCKFGFSIFLLSGQITSHMNILRLLS